MSVEQFSKLSLEEEMVTTRAGAAKLTKERPRAQQDSSQDQPLPSIESPPPGPSPPSLVISTNNLHYDVSAFNSDLRRRVKMGVEGNEIKMKYCAVSTDSNIDGARFYIDDDITVAIGANSRMPKCNCGANEKGLACKHIYWLADQILSTEDFDEQPIPLSPDGSAIHNFTPVDILNTKGLDNIADGLKWIVKKEDVPAYDDDIRDEIANMLSVFEPQDALPGEFKCPESPLTSERSRKYQKFAKLFTDYAVRDPGLFLQARGVIDPNFRRRVFFEKIDTRISRTFAALDEYITYGPIAASPDALRFDVPNCAKQLRALVNAIDELCREHDEVHSNVREVANRAAAALINILHRVVDRNNNAYEDISWGLEGPQDPAENNLFVALVGQDDSEEPPFVLHTLGSLPQDDVLRNHWETLQSIELKLEGYDTPPDYANAFRRILHDSRKRAASEVREGESKRAMQE